jgi:hypothetical protein
VDAHLYSNRHYISSEIQETNDGISFEPCSFLASKQSCLYSFLYLQPFGHNDHPSEIMECRSQEILAHNFLCFLPRLLDLGSECMLFRHAFFNYPQLMAYPQLEMIEREHSQWLKNKV